MTQTITTDVREMRQTITTGVREMRQTITISNGGKADHYHK